MRFALAVACRVYRGIQGKTLPEEFWIENEFGVKGGYKASNQQ